MLATPDFAQTFPCSLRKLNLCSLSRLERLLGLDRRYIRALAAVAGRYYSPFSKPGKPKPFERISKPRKLRVIDNPSEELKAVQSLITERLLKQIELPDHVCGGVKGKSVLDNVAFHSGARVLIKVDIARFFPSITNVHVYRVWAGLLGCSPEISGLLTQLTTFERHLPQGAPSSTLLANLVLYSADGPIRAECERLGIRYSSWIDDLAFSSDDPRPIVPLVVATLRNSGFRISRKKLEIIGPRERKILNGVVLGRRVSVPSERLARVRSGIHKLREGKVPAAEVDRYVEGLRGSVAQISTIDRAMAPRLRKDLEFARKHC
jgi:RNA-directed DNA polymerase